MEVYDAGLLSDYGGGNVEWWQDYIRAELERAHDFYEVENNAILSNLAQVEAERDRLKDTLTMLSMLSDKPREYQWRDSFGDLVDADMSNAGDVFGVGAEYAEHRIAWVSKDALAALDAKEKVKP